MTKAMNPYRTCISCSILLLMLASCSTQGSRATAAENTQKDSVLQSDKCTQCVVPPDGVVVPTNLDPDAKDHSEHYIYDVVEYMPNFPGGQVALMKFIEQNKRYPKDALEEKVQGRVIITLVVEKDGSLSNIEVYKGVRPSLDEEALRIVRSMPKWKPGMQDGKHVRVRYFIPISFRLELLPQPQPERKTLPKGIIGAKV